MVKIKTTHMRVPLEFKNEIMKISEKRNYPSTTKFLSIEGVRLFKNADKITSFMDNFRFDSFFGSKKNFDDFKIKGGGLKSKKKKNHEKYSTL